MKIKVKRLSENSKIPHYQTPGAAGFDFHLTEDVEILPGETKLLKTGLSFEIPEGFELQVRPRSGMSLKTPLRVANAPGTVDSDYRGEVAIIMSNMSSGCSGQKVTLLAGERVAQGVICPIIQATFEETSDLSETERGLGAFGSTGK